MSDQLMAERERDTYNIALEQIAHLVGLPVDREGFPEDFAENVVKHVAQHIEDLERRLAICEADIGPHGLAQLYADSGENISSE